MRIAVIGLGDIARKAYLPVVANHPEITPLLCTRNGANLLALGKQYRIAETFGTIDDLLAHKPDAAMVHSSTESHALLLRKLLTAGIPTFVDKPLSYHLHECEDLLNLAEQKQLPLSLGFNRRYAPLIAPLAQVSRPTQIYWQKNRAGSPENARTFIYDDFIHVLDSVRFLAAGEPRDLRIFAQGENHLLATIQVQWQGGDTLVSASMNHTSGIDEERLEFFSEQQKWQIDNLTSGIHYQKNKQQSLGFNNWDTTLYKRGFVTMIDAWIAQVKSGSLSDHGDILATHSLCEAVVDYANKTLGVVD